MANYEIKVNCTNPGLFNEFYDYQVSEFIRIIRAYGSDSICYNKERKEEDHFFLTVNEKSNLVPLIIFGCEFGIRTREERNVKNHFEITVKVNGGHDEYIRLRDMIHTQLVGILAYIENGILLHADDKNQEIICAIGAGTDYYPRIIFISNDFLK